MHAARKTAENRKILHDLVPLNSLSQERFWELSEKILIETVKAGHYLFRKGDRDNQTIFLLEGTLNLIDGFRKIAGEVKAGTEQSRHPVSNLQPRQYAARAVTRCVIASIDSGLLDVFLRWDPSNASVVVDIGAADNSDWMTRMLQSKAFVRLPPSMLQSLLMRFKPVEVKKGQVIITQDSEGEHFYTIHEGRCVVTRREDPGAPEKALAELGNGDSFGEESLVSESRRNASVTMLTDGLLMCLAKKDFVDLLKTQLVKYIDYDEARRLVDDGAVWVDVRTPDEYECGSFEDSVNIPLSTLRGEMPELVYNAKYVICCDTGSRSDSAAFVLSHKGFDVYVLTGGMAGLPVDAGIIQVDSTPVLDAELSGAGSDGQFELLLVEYEQERQARQRVEQQLEMVRGELAESGEKLGEYYSRVNRLEEEKQRFNERYESLREKHADELQALSEELEHGKMQYHKLHSEKEEYEAQSLRLRRQLDMALHGARAPDDGQHGAHAEDFALQAANASGSYEERAQFGKLHAELKNARTEIIHLQKVVRSIAGEKHQVEEQLQRFAKTLDTMRESMRRMTEGLSVVQGAVGSPRDSTVMPGGGGNIEG